MSTHQLTVVERNAFGPDTWRDAEGESGIPLGGSIEDRISVRAIALAHHTDKLTVK
jgi:hypothetical protein